MTPTNYPTDLTDAQWEQLLPYLPKSSPVGRPLKWEMRSIINLNAFKFLCKMSSSNFPIRLLFIDADHSYERVMETLEICVPHVLPRGWITLHDYNRHSGGPDITEVVQAAQDFLRTALDEFEGIFLTHGLLCLRKR